MHARAGSNSIRRPAIPAAAMSPKGVTKKLVKAKANPSQPITLAAAACGFRNLMAYRASDKCKAALSVIAIAPYMCSWPSQRSGAHL